MNWCINLAVRGTTDEIVAMALTTIKIETEPKLVNGAGNVVPDGQW